VSQRNHLSQSTTRLKTLKRRVLTDLVRTYYPLADTIATVSKGVALDLAKVLDMPVERFCVTYNPVVTSELAERASEPLDHPWFSGEGPPVFLGVGKLDRQKDFPTLVRAFARVREQREARLVILGEGKQRAALETLVAELGIGSDVDLPGFVENPFAFMSRAGTMVLSSLYEGLPGVLIQAMACGCPVVSTDCPSGPSEILAGGKYGPLVPISDPESLAEAMHSSLDAPISAELLREGAEPFSVDRSCERYLEAMFGER